MTKKMDKMFHLVFILSFCFCLSVTTLPSDEDWKHLSLSLNDCNVTLLTLANTSNGTIVTLGNCTYTLTSQLNISAVQGIHIIGNDSVINCIGDAGMMFKMVTDLLLEKLTIRHCGFRVSEDKQQIASVQIIISSKVTIKNVTIENGTGTGLSLINVGGNVTIRDCVFRYNNYKVYQVYRVLNTTHNDFSQRGGGMQILIDNHSTIQSLYQIQSCSFTSNFASSGGGLFVAIYYGPQKLDIHFTNCDFFNNECTKGGGGVQVGYITEKGECHNNTVDNIVFERCNFKCNEALYGGGVSIFSSLGTPKFAENKLKLSHCSWSRNLATKNGMAVDVAIAPWETIPRRDYFPILQFENCNFTEHSDKNIFNSSKSIFAVTELEVRFCKQIIFEDNNGSAIYAKTAVLNIGEKANITFKNNRGSNGGALKLKSFSVIMLSENSTFLLQGNSAVKQGGALYVKSLYEHSSTCFIRYKENNKKNANFIFVNNTASLDRHRNTGNSAYASSFMPCLEKCSNTQDYTLKLVSKALECLGNFTFDDTNLTNQFASAAHHFSAKDTSNIQDTLCDLFINDSMIYWKPTNRTKVIGHHIINETLSLIPGKITEVPIKLVDEFCEEVHFEASVAVLESTNRSMITSKSFVTDNYITIYGNPYDSGIIQFSAVGVRDVTLRVRLEDCPPGYIHDNTEKICVCSVYTKSNYPGIKNCSNLEYKAYVKQGYWLGYVNQTKHKTLASAICPKGFCANNTTESPLPSVAANNLSLHICNKNRTGIVCGSCKENYTTHYRTTSFSCKSIQLCYLGWLFYMGSEIIPVTIMFFIVIYFNISFTSGALNGIIFFMQIVNTLKVDGENTIEFSETVTRFSRIHKILYRTFNLKFFALEELSFCLWEGATALDMLAFRYVTIVYSLFLVIITVVILRKCTCRFGKGKDQTTKTSLNLKHSILNGLSAFLVMSYSECAQVTLMIITRGTLIIGPIQSMYTKYEYESVAFYNGDCNYMSPEHIKSALPAIAFLLTLVAWPPILLIVYPLCYKLFALLRVDESKFVKATCKIIPLEKIKPLFDSIQGEFKDKYRFFAGLYLFYRLWAAIIFTYGSSLNHYYFVTTILLIFILVLHSIIWPYKKKWHNVVDALLFANLAVINLISFLNHVSQNQSVVKILTSIQCGLILLPLVYLVVYAAYNIVKKIKVKTTSFKSNSSLDYDNDSNDILEMLDAREPDSSDEQSDYVLLKED